MWTFAFHLPDKLECKPRLVEIAKTFWSVDCQTAICQPFYLACLPETHALMTIIGKDKLRFEGEETVSNFFAACRLNNERNGGFIGHHCPARLQANYAPNLQLFVVFCSKLKRFMPKPKFDDMGCMKDATADDRKYEYEGLAHEPNRKELKAALFALDGKKVGDNDLFMEGVHTMKAYLKYLTDPVREELRALVAEGGTSL